MAAHAGSGRLRFLLVTILALAFLLATPGTASAKELHWTSYDITIDLHDGGAFTVTEAQVISFDVGTFREGFAVIPLGRVEEITNVQVSEDGLAYQRGSGTPGTYSVHIAGGEIEILWWFEPARAEQRQFTISYDVTGGLRVYDNREQLWWRVIDRDFSADIDSSIIMVNLPQAVPQEQLTVEHFTGGVEGVTAQVFNGQQIRFNAEDIQRGDWLETRVSFPKMTSAVEPTWQAADDAQRAEEERLEPYKAAANVLLLGAGLLIALGGPLGAGIVWYTRGRDAPVTLPIDLLREPPDDLPPGAVGTLIDETADVHDLIATLVDLAERGFLEIEEDQTELLGITLKRDWILRRLHAEGELRNSERALLNALFASSGETSVKMSDVRKNFAKQVPIIRKTIYAELVAHGYFPRNPEQVRNRWRLAGFAMLGVSILLTFNLWNRVAANYPFAIAPVIGLGIAGLALVIASGVMPHKTPKGAEAAAKWLAFKRYLEEIEQYQNVGEAGAIFAHFLPFAIAFRIEKGWVRKFAQIDAPAPYWYRTSRRGRCRSA